MAWIYKHIPIICFFLVMYYLTLNVLPILGETAPLVEPKPNCQNSGPIIGSHKLERVSNPCSPNAIGTETPPSGKLVNKNQARVGSVKKKQNRHHSRNTLSDNGYDPNVDNGLFTVKVSLGTPPQYYNLIVDTGSRWTWVRCQSCMEGCNSTDPLYDPSKSPCKARIPSRFHVTYSDNSYIDGIWGCDSLTIDDLGTIMNFQFGCGLNNVDGSGDNFVGAGGYLGLGKGESSLVSRISEFSYFVPESGGAADLQFEDKARAKSDTCSNQFTPMVQGYEYDQAKYYIDLVGISVDGNDVSIPFFSLKTTIDSGTVITRLPQEVYSVFRYAIRQSMLSYTLLEGVHELMDTCYSLEGIESIVFPEITFHFGKENTIDVTLSKEGTIWKIKDNVSCLAFAPTEFYKNSIIGIVQQRGFNVLYDLEGERIGFGTNCG